MKKKQKEDATGRFDINERKTRNERRMHTKNGTIQNKLKNENFDLPTMQIL